MPAMIERFQETRTPVAHCKVCGDATRHHKPFCSNHIMQSSYVQALCEIVTKTKQEVESVVDYGLTGVDLDGPIVKEILAGLAELKELTYRSLIKDRVVALNKVDPKVAAYYLERLHHEGLVKITRNNRRAKVVSLTPKGWKVHRHR